MSTYDDKSYSNAEAASASDTIRKAFAALPWDQKITTLLRVELDMVGDVVETVAQAASRAADEIADAFSGRKPADSATADSPATPA